MIQIIFLILFCSGIIQAMEQHNLAYRALLERKRILKTLINKHSNNPQLRPEYERILQETIDDIEYADNLKNNIPAIKPTRKISPHTPVITYTYAMNNTSINTASPHQDQSDPSPGCCCFPLLGSSKRSILHFMKYRR